VSYENTKCPCGGEKPCDTMLCDECLKAFADHPSMKAFDDPQGNLTYRKQAAIILCSLAHSRKRTTVNQ
jgi:hypothetical protein